MDAQLPPGAPDIRLFLSSVGTSVNGSAVLDDRLLSVIVVEDACWAFARDAWISRQPHSWQRHKLARWHAEHDQLCAQRDLIRALARSCGLLTV